MIRLALAFFLSISSVAYASLNRVESISCGEFDPQVIGDACLIVATNSNNTNIFITKIEAYTNSSTQVKVGDFISTNDNANSAVTELAVRVLARKLTSHLSFHVSDIYYLDYKDSVATLNSLNKVETISCVNDKFIDQNGFMFGKFSLKARLHTYNPESYSLENTSLSYLLSMEEDFSETWAEGSYTNGSFLNRYNYRPYVYKNHIKFGSLFSDKVFGKIDLLINKADLGKKNFTGIVMMTHMDDHFGTTIEVSCETL